MRTYPDWVDAFVDLNASLPTPSLFRKWAAISAVAGALERKVWLRMFDEQLWLYPHIYVALVGPPGVGKTVAISQVYDLWHKLEDHHVSPSNLTKAALIDSLSEAARRVLRPMDTPNYVEFHSLLVPSNELGVLMPTYENEFMNVLTDIYDSKPYHERRRGGDLNIELAKPQLNILAGTTPSYLISVMPEGAWDQGFISRVFLVYSGEAVQRKLFGRNGSQEAELKRKALELDLKEIGKLYGQFDMENEAMDAAEAWDSTGGHPVPAHPKLRHYNTRRTSQHIMKLSMLASVSRSSELVIRLEDFQRAQGWLLEIESYMEDIFKSQSSGGDAKAMELAWFQVLAYSGKHKNEPMPDPILHVVLGELVPAYAVSRVIDLMVRSQMLKLVGTPAGPAYKALPRAPQ